MYFEVRTIRVQIHHKALADGFLSTLLPGKSKTHVLAQSYLLLTNLIG